MSFSIQKFIELLAYCGGISAFCDFFFDSVVDGDKFDRTIFIVILLVVAVSSFVIKG